MSSSQIPFSHRNNTGRISSSNSSSASSSSHRGGPFNNHSHWGTSNGPADLDQPFTREMRDRQARGKDPYSAGDDMDDGSDASPGRIGGHHQSSRNSNSGGRHHQQQPKEPFSKVERRDWAETVLDNPELLMMYAQSSGDTLPATRYKFKKIMCGFEEDDEDDEDSIPDTRGVGNYQQQHQQFQAQQRASSVQQQRGRGDRPHGGRR
ncbi:hypothetical protein SLS53_001266 [Cytospora paraplurivora]|uniref:Uncharacterized protein n=1 Tax=Cytospora paraplurivora TaxID=2898453 RepID=A0AAN9UGS5_9PEZI